VKLPRKLAMATAAQAPSPTTSRIFRAPSMTFQLDSSASTTKGRTGRMTFNSEENVSVRKVETPACVVYTRRGAVPHLTRDNVARLPVEMLHLSLEHL
jgi:queuine tRNA-ribosyltransferase subunit QTRTD1